MFTVTGTEALQVACERLVRVVQIDVHYGVERFLKRLAILTPTTLQVNSPTSGTQSSNHELRTRLTEACALCVAVIDHREVIYP